MPNNENNEKPMWKGTITFALVNMVMVWLCTKLGILLISVTMIILIVCGISVSLEGIKKDWVAGRKGSSILCVLGLMINICAMLYYVVVVLVSLLRSVLSFF